MAFVSAGQTTYMEGTLTQANARMTLDAFITAANNTLAPLAVTVAPTDSANEQSITLEARLGDHSRTSAFRLWRSLNMQTDIVPSNHPLLAENQHIATVRIHPERVYMDAHDAIVAVTDMTDNPIQHKLNAASPVVAVFERCKVVLKATSVLNDPKGTREALWGLFRALLGGELANRDDKTDIYAVAYLTAVPDPNAALKLARVLKEAVPSTTADVMVPRGVDGPLAACTYLSMDDEDRQNAQYPAWFSMLRLVCNEYDVPDVLISLRAAEDGEPIFDCNMLNAGS